MPEGFITRNAHLLPPSDYPLRTQGAKRVHGIYILYAMGVDIGDKESMQKINKADKEAHAQAATDFVRVLDTFAKDWKDLDPEILIEEMKKIQSESGIDEDNNIPYETGADDRILDAVRKALKMNKDDVPDLKFVIKSKYGKGGIAAALTTLIALIAIGVSHRVANQKAKMPDPVKTASGSVQSANKKPDAPETKKPESAGGGGPGETHEETASSKIRLVVYDAFSQPKYTESFKGIGPIEVRAVGFKGYISLPEADVVKGDFSNVQADEGSTFAGGKFANTLFNNARLIYTNLAYTTFIGCDFSNADLRYADLTGTKFYGCIFNEFTNFTGCWYDNRTVFPKGFNPAAHGMRNKDTDPSGYTTELARKLLEEAEKHPNQN